MIVILYGVAALAMGLVFLPSVLRYPKFIEFLSVAFVFFVIHTAVDSGFEPPTTASAIVEESAKLYCAAFIALAMITGLLSVARDSGRDEGANRRP